MPRVVGIVQARLNSSRLPGKMLFDLGGRPVLARVLERLRTSRRLDELVAAIPDTPGDRALADRCAELGVPCRVGPEDDVLARMHNAARWAGADVVVRLCGDNPVQDGAFVDMVVERQAATGGYVGAMPGFSAGLPAGFSAEVFPFAALDAALRDDATPEGREHVTPHIRKGLAGVPVTYMDFDGGPDRARLRLALDSAEDYALLGKIFAHFADAEFSWQEALEALAARPEWQRINRDTAQRDLASLSGDDRLVSKNAFDGNLVRGGVRAFTRTTRRDAHTGNREKAVSRFLDPATGDLRSELTRPRACPLCGADRPHLLFVKEGFHHQRCPDCGMIYVAPSLKNETLHSHSMNETSWFRVLTNETQAAMDRRKFVYGLDVLETHCPEGGRLLDVGCGPGVFLGEAKQRGWDVHGVEFNAYCVSLLREQGIPVTSSPLDENRLPAGSFQAASAWDVLEHVLAPMDFVAEVARLLAPGGVFLAAVPNAAGLASRILHEKSVTFAGEAHVNAFTPATLRRLLERNGLQVLHVETYLTELGTINNHLAYEDPYAGDAGPLLDFLTPAYLHGNLLGSRLLMAARKGGVPDRTVGPTGRKDR